MVESISSKPKISAPAALSSDGGVSDAPIKAELPDYRPYEIAWRNFAGPTPEPAIDLTPPPKRSKYSAAPSEAQVASGEAVAQKGVKDTGDNHLIGDVQKYLNSYGETLAIDGKFGPKTEEALERHFGTKVIDRSLLEKIAAEKQIDQLHDSKGFQKISVEDRGAIDAALVKRQGPDREDLGVSFRSMINRPSFEALKPAVQSAAIGAMGKAEGSGAQEAVDTLVRSEGFSKLDEKTQLGLLECGGTKAKTLLQMTGHQDYATASPADQERYLREVWTSGISFLDIRALNG